MNPAYDAQWYHHVIAKHLEAVERGETLRLMIFAPPRHGKSMEVSEYFPAWYLGRNPDKRVIGCSYAAHLARDFSGRARNQIADDEYPYDVELATDTFSKESWNLEGHRGGYIAAGIGGPITGRGANLLLIDDPIKNAEEADSETYREAVWNWYLSTAYTRLEGETAAVVVIMTRWHEDDLAGRLEQQMRNDPEADQWTILNLPAIADEDEPWGRKAGEALWPSKFPVSRLKAIAKTIGERFWNALYKGRPSSAEGGILKRKWWKYWTYDDLPEMDVYIQSWDMAFKDGKANDYVCGQVWGQRGPNAYLLDQFHEQIDFVGTKAAVRAMTKKWPKAILKLVEDKANGPAIISELAATVPGLVAVNPEGSKFSRAAAVAPYVEGGNVYLPHPSLFPWVDGFVDECAAFPRGAHDDRVDTFSQAIHRLAHGLDEIDDGVVTYEDRVRVSPY